MATFEQNKKNVKEAFSSILTSKGFERDLFEKVEKELFIRGQHVPSGLLTSMKENGDVRKSIKKAIWKLSDLLDIYNVAEEERESYFIIEVDEKVDFANGLSYVYDLLGFEHEMDFQHQFTYCGVQHLPIDEDEIVTQINLQCYTSSIESILEFGIPNIDNFDVNRDEKGNVILS